jgi:hypothetical protein
VETSRLLKPDSCQEQKHKVDSLTPEWRMRQQLSQRKLDDSSVPHKKNNHPPRCVDGSHVMRVVEVLQPLAF